MNIIEVMCFFKFFQILHVANLFYEFDWDGQAFSNFPKLQVCNVYTISHKRSER